MNSVFIIRHRLDGLIDIMYGSTKLNAKETENGLFIYDNPHTNTAESKACFELLLEQYDYLIVNLNSYDPSFTELISWFEDNAEVRIDYHYKYHFKYALKSPKSD